jgi:hypothetical protein
MPKGDQKSLRPSWLPLWLWQRRWWIALATLFVLVWWLIPPLLYRHTGAGPDARLKAITDTRTALLAGLVGVGALLTFWLNSRQLQVNREGQITERFTRAIDQLGNDKGQLDVTLGGLYALERIAKDSPADRATIAEVLTAYVRGHAPGHPLGLGSTSRPLRLISSHPCSSGIPTCRQRSQSWVVCCPATVAALTYKRLTSERWTSPAPTWRGRT